MRLLWLSYLFSVASLKTKDIWKDCTYIRTNIVAVCAHFTYIFGAQLQPLCVRFFSYAISIVCVCFPAIFRAQMLTNANKYIHKPSEHICFMRLITGITVCVCASVSNKIKHNIALWRWQREAVCNKTRSEIGDIRKRQWEEAAKKYMLRRHWDKNAKGNRPKYIYIFVATTVPLLYRNKWSKLKKHTPAKHTLKHEKEKSFSQTKYNMKSEWASVCVSLNAMMSFF